MMNVILHIFIVLDAAPPRIFPLNKKGERRMNVMNATRISDKVENKKVKLLSARGMTVISVLSAISFVLMFFDVPLWFAPSFYQIDFSDVPVLVGAFALGPMAGVIIELIKILLNLLLQGTDTAGVGEIANFIIGCALVVPSALVYHTNRTRKTAIYGMITGTIVFVGIGCLLNAFVLLPTYAKVFGMPMEALIEMGTKVNPNIKGLGGFIFMAVAPFNLVKGVAVSLITILIYKRISPLIKGYHYNV
jgi:riboflavin transporter FmnP